MRPVVVALVAALAPSLAACGGDDEPAARDERPPAVGEGRGLAAVPGLVRRLEPSVVAVLVDTAQGGGEGSGVVWDERVVVTNDHVVAGARRVRIVLATGERLDAEVRATDPRTDLAVLDVERDLPPARFAEGLPVVGELAVALGNPLGFANSVTAGIVSGLDRAIPSGGTTPALVGLLQTDAAISPGNSGGALVDGDGTVIGINVAYIPPQARAVSIGFAIPAPVVRDTVRELLADGTAETPYLGIGVRPLTPELARRLGADREDGALVERVEPGSTAAAAGLRAGDVVVRLDDRPVRAVEDVFAALRERDPGDRVPVEVVRRGDRRELEVELAERPIEPARLRP